MATRSMVTLAATQKEKETAKTKNTMAVSLAVVAVIIVMVVAAEEAPAGVAACLPYGFSTCRAAPG